MKKVKYLIKAGVDFYFRQSSKTNVWTPTGTIPIGI